MRAPIQIWRDCLAWESKQLYGPCFRMMDDMINQIVPSAWPG
ncbi:hypothetical protein [Noviherbaspirillum denitrificans]|nr:hypothetical protein [Noviherbaspirillum denitrificans]